MKNRQIHLNQWGCQFSRLLAAEVCISAVVTLDTPCSEVVWRVLATHSIHQFPLHFPSRVSPCAIIFQPESTDNRKTASHSDTSASDLTCGLCRNRIPTATETSLKLFRGSPRRLHANARILSESTPFPSHHSLTTPLFDACLPTVP